LAYDQLRAGILAGNFQVGQKLSVVSLAEKMGMSRSPVRSAIERLASEGLVRLTPDGAILPSHSHGDLLDALAVRAVLEGLAAFLTAARLHAEDVEALEHIQRVFEAAVRADDTQAAKKADLEFHTKIQSCCGNPCLIEHLERVQARVILATYSTAWSSTHWHAIPEHDQILKALAARDASAAQRAATSHLANLSDRIRAEWLRRDREASETEGVRTGTDVK
jgi:DNA-binding GntR family transcriptional regulator